MDTIRNIVKIRQSNSHWSIIGSKKIQKRRIMMIMKKIIVVSVMLMLAAFLAGCASSGRQFNTTKVNDIKKGVHDKTDILAWFGEPFSKVALTGSSMKCIERWTYVYAHAVGFGTVTESHSLVVDFDATGKVCDSAYVKQK
jgi:outer membrane protein assembly factor BamE (lipoprotein component of BamABCDE complex)